MKRIGTCLVDIRISIREGDLVAYIMPAKETGIVPTCEVVDVGTLPYQVAAWIAFMEGKS